jgi:sec-independent protein translocase protein TatA
MGANIVSPTHLLFILVVLVLLFGAKKLPELGRGIGSAMREFKHGVTGVPETTQVHPDPAATQPTQLAPEAAVAVSAADATPRA